MHFLAVDLPGGWGTTLGIKTLIVMGLIPVGALVLGYTFLLKMMSHMQSRESARMILQFLDQLPSGPIMAKVPRIIKVPAGEVWVNAENPLGEMGYYVVSKGATGPFRVKIRSASFSNVSILPWLLKGLFVPDVITVLASLYFILGDIDR